MRITDKIKYYLVWVMLLLLSCENKIIVKVNIDKSATISFRLKKNEKYVLNYVDVFFKHHDLIFSNPGKSDSVFTKSVSLEVSTVFKGSIIAVEPNGKYVTSTYYYLISPGDSVNFFLEDAVHLKTVLSDKKRILNNPDVSFYHKFLNSKISFGQAKSNQDWEKKYKTFYINLKQINDKEKKMYDSLYRRNNIDSSYFRQLIIHSDILFYKIYFDYVVKTKDFTATIMSNYSKEFSNVLSLLDNPNTLLTGDLLDIFYGILRLKILDKGLDEQSPKLLFAEAIKLKLGIYRGRFLTSFLNWTPNNTNAYNEISAYIKRVYKDSIYETHINEMEESIAQQNKIMISDSLIQVNKFIISWNDLISSRKDTFIFIDFWASWCAPCRQQMPLLEKEKKYFEKDSIAFLSINIDKIEGDWLMASEAEKQFLKSNNFHLIGTEKSIAIKKWEINSIPRYMIFKNGKALYKDFIPPTDPDFRKILKKIIVDNK